MSGDWSEYLGEVGATVGRYIDSFEQQLCGGVDPVQDTEGFYSPEMETANPDELDDIIQDRLQWTAEYAIEASEYWADRFDEAGLEPADLEGPADLLELGSLDKQEFLSRQPPESDDYAWFVDPDGRSNNAHCTSGSTGIEKWVFVNEDDAELSDESVRRGYAAAGIDEASRLANFLPKGLYMSGKQSEDAANGYVDMHFAFGHTNTPPRDRLLEQFADTNVAPDSIIASPSSVERLARELDEYGEEPDEIGIGNILVVGEGSSEARRESIGETFDATVTNNYANTELGFTAYQSPDCDRDAMHVIEDLKLVMLVDEEEGRLVDEGEEGEVWVTPLYPEGMQGSTPMFNYKPGDVATELGRRDCDCGRSHRMIEGVRRSDNAVEANQAKITPDQVENIIHRDQFQDVLTGEYEVEIDTDGTDVDSLLIRVDAPDSYDTTLPETEAFLNEDELDYDALGTSILDEFLDEHVATAVFEEGDLLDVDVEVVDQGELELYDEPGKPTRFREV